LGSWASSELLLGAQAAAAPGAGKEACGRGCGEAVMYSGSSSCQENVIQVQLEK